MGVLSLLDNIIAISIKIIGTGIKVVDKAADIVDDGIVRPIKDVVDTASDSITRK